MHHRKRPRSLANLFKSDYYENYKGMIREINQLLKEPIEDFRRVNYLEFREDHMAGHRIALAIDPSHIDKSGNHTPGVGYFWSGCASAAKHGLEILDIAVIDADEKDAVHLKAVQTVDTVKVGRPPKYIAGMKNPNSLTAWYLRALAQEKDALLKISNIVPADCLFQEWIDCLVGPEVETGL